MSLPFDDSQLLSFLGLEPETSYLDLISRFRSIRPLFSTSNMDPLVTSCLAKVIVGRLEGKAVILSIHEHGVWATSEIPELFHRVRRSQGFDKKVYECSGEIIDETEADYLLCLTACCLFSGWDFSLISMDNSVTFYASHDEDMIVDSPDPSLKEALVQELLAFGLTIRGA